MRRAGAVLTALAVAAYPLLVYLGLTRGSVRVAGVIMLGLIAGRLAGTFAASRRRHIKALLPLPLGLVAFVTLSMAINDHRILLAMPVVVNGYLATVFLLSLWGTMPVVERMARLQVDDLSPPEVRYCRRLTGAWSVFLVANGGVTLVLALAAPIGWWAAYTGLISYVLLGFLFTVEYGVRKYLFRRFSESWHDRVLARIFPPPSR